MFALTMLLAALAQPDPVPVEHANFHRIVLATPDYAVLENIYPPKSDSGFHRHSRDLFYIVITPGKSATQRPGQKERAIPALKPGQVGMNEIGAEPLVHKVINYDDHPVQFVAFEVRRTSPSGEPISVRGPETRFVQLFDQARLRAWSLSLQPGETAPPLQLLGKGARVYVAGGRITVERPGQPPQILSVATGDIEQLATGETRGLTNSGTTPIQLIDVELK